MNDEFKEVFLPLILILLFILFGIFGLIVGIDYLDCRGFNKGTGIETRWTWGCYDPVVGGHSMWHLKAKKGWEILDNEGNFLDLKAKFSVPL